MNAVVLEPAVNVSAAEELRRRIRLVRDAAWMMQIDVADGILAQPKNVADPRTVAAELPPEKTHIHLMVEDVAAALDAWCPISPRRITFHVETSQAVPLLLERLHSDGIERGLALGPETPLERAVPHARAIDFLLFVSVPPGRSGQTFDPTTPGRVRLMHERFPRLRIGVDGGVKRDLFEPLVRAGVSSVSIGSAIFSSDDPLGEFTRLQDALAALG